MAAPRALFERIPFSTGYAVEMAMLLDAYRDVGLRGLAQVDLDVRQNDHKTLAGLGSMADHVLEAATRRLVREGRLVDPGPPVVDIVERPPMATVRAAAA
jgi:glucosyl-3-phosphoglycerate synthase